MIPIFLIIIIHTIFYRNNFKQINKDEIQMISKILNTNKILIITIFFNILNCTNDKICMFITINNEYITILLKIKEEIHF